MESIGSMTTPSNRRDWLIEHSSLLRAGSQFREKAQRYHNLILSNVSSARCAHERRRVRVGRSMEGPAPIC
jgi:hypothetical protein